MHISVINIPLKYRAKPVFFNPQSDESSHGLPVVTGAAHPNTIIPIVSLH